VTTELNIYLEDLVTTKLSEESFKNPTSKIELILLSL
jgi:hypothetical protein